MFPNGLTVAGETSTFRGSLPATSRLRATEGVADDHEYDKQCEAARASH